MEILRIHFNKIRGNIIVNQKLIKKSHKITSAAQKNKNQLSHRTIQTKIRQILQLLIVK